LNAGELLARTLESLGVGAVYGAPLRGVEVVVSEPEAAGLLSRAHARLFGERAAVHLGGGTLEVPPISSAAQVSSVLKIGSAAEIAELDAGRLSAGITLCVELDLTQPTDLWPPDATSAETWSDPDERVVRHVREAGTVTILCGPGVVKDRAVHGLHDLAAAGGLGVLNTWGAKGVFDWRSRHHFATAGLQQDDFALGGLADADLVIATGVDPLEAPPRLWSDYEHVSVEPSSLARLAELWPSARRTPDMPLLRDRLSIATQAGWGDLRSPMKPSRVTLGYSRCFGSGGLVAADPGSAGYWVARTFATTEVGSVHVPAEPDSAGMAAACCLVARLESPTRAVLAAVDAPVRDEVSMVLETAARLGVDLPVEVWDPDGARLDAEAHRIRLARAALGGLHGTFSISTDPSQLDQMIDAAGPIVAWTPTGT